MDIYNQNQTGAGKAFLTLVETSKLLNVSNKTIRRAIKAGRLASCRPYNKNRGKIFLRLADIEAFIERSRRSAIGE